MTFVVENLRLAELVAVAQSNRPMFDDLLSFLKSEGYSSLVAFVQEADDEVAYRVIHNYLVRPLPTDLHLFDGVARPYQANKAKFFLLAWILRDAPAQRLGPMVRSMPGRSLAERRAAILNLVRKHVREVLRDEGQWQWNAIMEVMVDRLEGSRRAIKGSLFEAIVRRCLSEVFEDEGICLSINDTEIRLQGETFDVSVKGPSETILMPVKTRETMGGGHALLFTRDIHKAITVAHDPGFECIPVVIAESWAGDLQSLDCENTIVIEMNPNQVTEIEPVLREKIRGTINAFIRLTT
jgi:hypothetical protein